MKTSLIITENVDPRCPYVWNHLDNTLDNYRKIIKNPHVIICGSGFCPDNIKQKYDMCWNDTYNNYQSGTESFLKILPQAFEIASAKKHDYVLLSPMLSWIRNIKNLDKKINVLGFRTPEKEVFINDIIYGQIKTVYDFLFNKRWNTSISKEKNIYNNLKNIVGEKSMKNFVTDNSSVDFCKRVVISRAEWEDIKW